MEPVDGIRVAQVPDLFDGRAGDCFVRFYRVNASFSSSGLIQICDQLGLALQKLEQLLQGTKAYLVAGVRAFEQGSPGGFLVVAHTPQAQQIRSIIGPLFFHDITFIPFNWACCSPFDADIAVSCRSHPA
jgi:hypothetical protein